mmetsp:Transcript_10598/g.14659  ORF Transcript_10598/g.14659 Transcript_10598/m.14659 type:complete len:87 (+) Transcript_10598:2641-2901(+)
MRRKEIPECFEPAAGISTAQETPHTMEDTQMTSAPSASTTAEPLVNTPISPISAVAPFIPGTEAVSNSHQTPVTMADVQMESVHVI